MIKHALRYTVLALLVAGCGTTADVAPMAQTEEAGLVRVLKHFGGDLKDRNVYLGNGVIGYRIKPNPFESWKGVASGYVKTWEECLHDTLAYAPYPFATDFKLGDGDSMMGRKDQVKVLEQRLDMSCGELTTKLEFPMGSGTAKATVLQFVSRSCPVIACQEVRLTVPAAGPLETRIGLSCGPGAKVDGTMPPNNDKVADLMALYTTDRSECGVTLRVSVDGAGEVKREFVGKKEAPGTVFRCAVKEGQEVVVRTIAATMTSMYHCEPGIDSCRMVNWGWSQGFDKLRALNQKAWKEIWRSRIRVTGDEDAQRYLDACLFYLFSSAHRSCRTSIPPFGTSQVLNYYGHVFWDGDTYMFPALLITSPETARMMMDYRFRHLEPARKRAQAFGYRGVMYPWQSDSRGFEGTASFVDCAWLEQHINLSVGEAAWRYYLATGDREYARTQAWPILKGVAEWVESRLTKTDRGYELLDIMGVVEGEHVNNPCYVNALCAAVLRDAARCAEVAGEEAPASWARVADEVYLPRGPAPEGSSVKGEILYNHDGGANVPGAGMFMVGFPYDLGFDRELLKRSFVHYYDIPKEVLSMGHAYVVGEAAFVGDRRRAREAFHDVVRQLSEPIWGMGREYTSANTTCFVTTQGAMVEVALMGFTGLRFEPGNWNKYEACLPEGWEKIEVDRIWLGGKPYRLTALHGRKAALQPVD